MTSLVAGPASRCAGAGNRVGRDRTSGRAESNGMCGRRSRGRLPEFPNIKERLLAAASDLFYRCGVRAVSVDEIVKAAGVVKPTFYRGYPSKDLLITACVSADADRIRDSTIIRTKTYVKVRPCKPLRLGHAGGSALDPCIVYSIRLTHSTC
jgi:AcrR family transcriptional regulator